MHRWRTIDLSGKQDCRGSLGFAQSPDHFGFLIKRCYYLYNVPYGKIRGQHAHINLKQVVIPIVGSFKIYLTDTIEEETIICDHPLKAVLIEGLVWRELSNFSDNAVCLVLASEEYKREDYIWSLEELRVRVGKELKC